MNAPPFPDVFRIEPSSLCNLRCCHCFTGQNPGIGGIMKHETFNKVMDEIIYHKPRVVVLYHGGEPFLNPNLLNMIRTVKDAKVPKTKLNTNGMLVDDLRGIVKSGLDFIVFSIDGRTPHENNDIRTGSNYAKVRNTIQNLVRIKKEMECDHPHITIVNVQMPTKVELETPTHNAPDFLLRDFKGLDVELKMNRAIYWAGLDLKHSGFFLNDSTKTNNHCATSTETITIRWNGDVVPCCLDIQNWCVMGNIFEHRLEEIWRNDNYNRLRESLFNMEFLPLCENCHFVRVGRYLMQTNGASIQTTPSDHNRNR